MEFIDSYSGLHNNSKRIVKCNLIIKLLKNQISKIWFNYNVFIIKTVLKVNELINYNTN